MTEILEIKQQFIELRAKGHSLTKIAGKLGKCRQTLSNWNSELEEEISNARALELEALFEEFLLTKEHRIKALSQLLCKIDQELNKRDFQLVADEKLVELKLKLTSQLKEEYIEPKIKSESELKTKKANREFLNKF
jgi:transcriptional regulator